MRKISKSKPPSNVSPDGQPPRGMKEAELRFKASLASVASADHASHARTQFDGLDKSKLRAVLYVEQGHICVYCENRVKEKANEGSKTPHIEHWLPLGGRPDQALHWRNLYLSCHSTETCDGSKSDTRLVWSDQDKDLPWPAEAPYEKWIGFTSAGEAYVRADAPEAKRRALELALADQVDGKRKRKSILNLNHPALVAARSEAIRSEQERLKREFGGQTAPEIERQARAKAMLQENMYPTFVSIRVAYLTRQLGKSKAAGP
jgi:uncharacterized protein (TIGR02646 family)